MPVKQILSIFLLCAVLVPAGAQSAWNNRADASVKAQVSEWRGDSPRITADNYLQYLPAAVDAGFGAAGLGGGNFSEHLAAVLTAYAAEAVMVNGLKYSLCRMRPDGSRANSFPSGHSATAFTGAELVRLEYGPWWGAGAYLVAAGTGFLRIYNNRHWFTDVLAGAGIGILSANIAYRLLPLERRWLGNIACRLLPPERRWLGIPEGHVRISLLPGIPLTPSGSSPEQGSSPVTYGLSCNILF